MIANLYQDASVVLSTTSHHLSKISENIASSKITENVVKISEVINRKLHLQHRLNCGGSLNPDTARQRYKKHSPNSLYNSLTRFEGLAIKQGILPELDEEDLELTKVIGRGAYGDVYEGVLRDRETGKDHNVAIKSLKRRGMTVAAFLRELHILRLCGTHPNVIKFYGALTCNSTRPKVILELCPKGDLFRLISQCNPCHDRKTIYGSVKDGTMFTFTQIFQLLRDVARGLEHLHRRGIVHQDLSARNILLDETYRPKISDFGLSSHHVDATREHETKQGVAIPVRWAAPEVVLDRLYSNKSDIWSYGILIGEVVSYGDVPWPKLSQTDIRRAMKKKLPPEPPHNTYFPLQQILLQCWEYEPQKRPALEQLAEAIGNFNVSS
ncbi:hypothetical protein ACHWQZ_G006861 [Mnemiopsis leidyi]